MPILSLILLIASIAAFKMLESPYSGIVGIPLMVLGLLTNPTFHGDKKYKKALKLEKKGQYKESAKLYAEAVMEGSMASGDCKKHFLRLWKKFGPFDYRKDFEVALETKKQALIREGDTPESCNESGLAVWIREEDALLQIVDCLTGKKESLAPLKEVTIFKKWKLEASHGVVRVSPKDPSEVATPGEEG